MAREVLVDDPAHWSEVDWSSSSRDVVLSGRRMRFIDAGEGPAVLLLHGLGGSRHHWAANFGALSGAGYRVVAPDLPGFGRSDRLPAHRDLTGYIDAAVALMDHLGQERFILGGHSMGALIAMQTAHAVPDRAAALILVSGGGFRMEPRRLKLIVRASGAVGAAVGVAATRRAMLDGGPLRSAMLRPLVADPRAIPRRFLGQIMQGVRAPGLPEAVRAAVRSAEAVDARDVRAPTLVLWGERDRLVPVAHGRALTRRLPDAEIQVAGAVGHCPMFEVPTWFNAAVLDFLARKPGHQAPLVNVDSRFAC